MAQKVSAAGGQDRQRVPRPLARAQAAGQQHQLVSGRRLEDRHILLQPRIPG